MPANEPTAHGFQPLRRARLLDRIMEGLDKAVVLLDAPAGYGKTTLLEQVRAELAARGTLCVNVQVDRGAQFIDVLEEAVRASLGGAAQERASLVALGTARPIARLSGLLRELAAVGGPVCLLIDDAHLAAASSDGDMVYERLFEGVPGGFPIVVATRDRSRLPTSRVRTRRGALELTADDLRLTLDEARELFGPAAPSDLLTGLLERTEGWPAAIHLVQISSVADGGVDGQLSTLSGSQSTISDYLSERVFRQMSGDQQAFLVEVAHLCRVHGDLADHVRQRDDSWRLLRELQLAGALLQPVDGEPGSGWFRVHPLFLEFLRYQQMFLGEAQVRALHLRAAEWHAGRGDLDAAATHAKAAQDFERAIAFIYAAGGVRIGLRSGAGYLRALMDRLPISLIYSRPRMKLCWAFVLAKEGRQAEADRLFDEVAAVADPDDRDLDDDIAITRALFRIYGDRAFTSADTARLHRVIEATPLVELLVRGVLLNALCVVQMQAGDFTAARRSAEDAMAYYRDNGSLYLQYCMHVYFAILDFEQGCLDDAFGEAQAASAMAHRSLPEDGRLKAIADALCSAVAWDQGAVETAADLNASALRSIDSWEGWSDVYLPAYWVGLELAQQHGGAQAVQDVLERAQRLVERRGILRLQRLLACRRLDLAVRTGDERAAGELCDTVRALLDDSNVEVLLHWRGRQMAALALARYEIVYGDLAVARQLIQTVLSATNLAGSIRFNLKAQILLVMARARAGDVREAMHTLQVAVAMGRRRMSMGAFLEEGERLGVAVRTIVREAGISQLSKEESDYIAEILSRIGADRPSGSGLLSAREREVLFELVGGSPNKVIARRLGLSEPTVKFHLKHIYSKLGVNKRGLAVLVARKYGFDKPPAALPESAEEPKPDDLEQAVD